MSHSKVTIEGAEYTLRPVSSPILAHEVWLVATVSATAAAGAAMCMLVAGGLPPGARLRTSPSAGVSVEQWGRAAIDAVVTAGVPVKRALAVAHHCLAIVNEAAADAYLPTQREVEAAKIPLAEAAGSSESG